MSTTKKGFMKAGGILGIIGAGLMLLTAITFIIAFNMINYDFVVEILGAEATLYTEEEILLIVSTAKVVVVMITIFVLGLGIANLVLSIKVLKNANAGVTKKGIVIALLVLSLLVSNLITFAFMIVVLCLKDKIAPTTAAIEQ